MNFDYSYQIKSYPFSKSEISQIQDDEYVRQNYPIVYIIYDTTKMVAYVGESTNAINRMANHLTHVEKKKLKCVSIISSKLFHKSAALDIESRLIVGMAADGKFKLLNGNGGVAEHNYYQKDEYSELFRRLWKELTFDNVKMKDILELENSDLFKYSPYKSLTEDQYHSIIEILKGFSNPNTKSIFVNGSAGTGKTILAIYLIKILSTINKDGLDGIDIEDEMLRQELEIIAGNLKNKLKIGFVVPMTSLRATLKNVFKSIHGLSGSMVVGPTQVVKDNYDLIVVDEAHRLTRRKSIMGYQSFDDVNKKLGLYKSKTEKGKVVCDSEECGNQLDWMVMSSRKQLMFYDSEQSIKPADVRKKDFDKIKKEKSSIELTLVSQMRTQGGNGYIDFVHNLLNTSLGPDESYRSPQYDLRLFDEMPDMVTELRSMEKKYGLCRLTSGISSKWVSKDSNIHDTEIDGVKLTWNKTASDWINSTTDMTEMGCIHTVQGYDLNYVGVIFGEEIDYDEASNQIVIDRAKYHDAKGKQAVKSDDELLEYIIKIYKTLMYRGIRGAFVYAQNESLRNYFKKYIS